MGGVLKVAPIRHPGSRKVVMAMFGEHKFAVILLFVETKRTREVIMYSHPRSRSIVLAVLFWALLGSSTALLADEGDARLKKRIAELETENRALRKIIGELQGVLKTVPESTTLVSKKANGLR